MCCKPLYLVVTRDKYELPVAVGDNMEDLSKQLGIAISSVSRGVNRARASGWKKGIYREVWVEMDEER